jgi:hypothetical protein
MAILAAAVHLTIFAKIAKRSRLKIANRMSKISFAMTILAVFMAISPKNEPLNVSYNGGNRTYRNNAP